MSATVPLIPVPRRVLAVCLRRLGDVLLATALIRSLRGAWPDAELTVLVFADTASMLQGNPDIDQLIELPRHGRWLSAMWPLFRRYDLALALQTSDRAHWVARWCGRRTAGLIPPPGEPGRLWKRLLNRYCATPTAAQHAVTRYLALADPLGILRRTELVPPRMVGFSPAVNRLSAQRYAVVHPMPMYAYKAWPDAQWRQTIEYLLSKGLAVIVTGGPAVSERRQIEQMLAPLDASQPVRNACGELSLAELAEVISSAAVFIGPDTSVTHLAAACGTPVIAVFGPSDPVNWGPWPAGTAAEIDSPWARQAADQRSGNVVMLQGTQARFPGCIPCTLEGCERRPDSRSDCLDGLSFGRVAAAIDRQLAPGVASIA